MCVGAHASGSILLDIYHPEQVAVILGPVCAEVENIKMAKLLYNLSFNNPNFLLRPRNWNVLLRIPLTSVKGNHISER